MLAKVTSFALIGLESTLVQVEVDISRGLPSQTIVGLPDAAVHESSERVRAAIGNSGLILPRARAHGQPGPGRPAQGGPGLRPAHRRRHPAGLRAGERRPGAMPAWSGELSLDGQVRHVTGVLPMAAAAREQG